MKNKIDVTFDSNMIRGIVINDIPFETDTMYDMLYAKKLFLPTIETGVKTYVLDYGEKLTPDTFRELVMKRVVTWEDINEVQTKYDLMDNSLHDYLNDQRRYRLWMLGIVTILLVFISVLPYESQMIVGYSMFASLVILLVIKVLVYLGVLPRVFLLDKAMDTQGIMIFITVMLPSILIFG